MFYLWIYLNYWECHLITTYAFNKHHHWLWLDLWLISKAHNWQKCKSTFLTCPCHKIYRAEAVGLKSSNYSLNVNEWKFHSPIEWNSCKPLKKEWFCTLNSKFPLIKSENHSKKSELPLIWGVKRRTTRKRIVLRLTHQTSGNSLFLESFSLYMSGNLLFNIQNHSFLSGLQEFHSFGEWNFHSFTFREYTFRIKIFVNMWNLGQVWENLYFVDNCLIKVWI